MTNAPTYVQPQTKPRKHGKLISVQSIQKYKFPLLLFILHIPFGILLYRVHSLVWLHQIGVLFVGLYYAVRKHEKIEKAACVTAYLVGIEVLWRMTYSSLFWESGKYGAAAIMIVALLQRGYLKIPKFPLLYFIFLVPSCFLTLIENSIPAARGKLSSTMSGPFLLLISCWFFSYLKINVTQLKKLLILITVPLVSVAVTTLFYTFTAEDIQFNTESNSATSGGFGPNQVSSMLGLGVFVCLACYLLFKNSFKDTIYLGLLCVLFAVQSVLTFSRGGIYNAIGGVLVIVIFQMRNLSQGVKRFLPIAGIALIFVLLIFPYLDDFTGGKLQERFDDTGTSNRTVIMESDFQIFLENPVLGLGVGQANDARTEYLDRKASTHTEFTRLLSEHGVFGVLSLIALGFGTLYNFNRQKSAMGKAFVVGVVIWSALYMTNAAMRLAAPSFMWGLSSLTILIPQIRKKNIKSSKLNVEKPVSKNFFE